MLIQDILHAIESVAPPAYQESYDNAGLITGRAGWEVKQILLTLDCTEDVVEEAIRKGCNLIIAHHPIIFSGLKRLTGNTYVERTIIKAIKHDIAIYAAHTNLDNVQEGVNGMICEKLGIQDTRPLEYKKDTLEVLYTFVPLEDADQVRDALFKAGAGQIGNYSEASFNTTGKGTFKPIKAAHPTIGTLNQRETVDEIRIEVIYPRVRREQILKALREAHPYETPAIDLIKMENQNQEIGSGRIGVLWEEMEEMDFLKLIRQQMHAEGIRYTRLLGKKVKKVAVCGGSGSFLLKAALRAQADFFVTADFKYHEFFDAEDQLVIADIGHFESEQYTRELFDRIIRKKFPNFAPLISEVRTNPINYLH